MDNNKSILGDEVKKFLNKEICVEIDRPLNSLHPKHSFEYEVNYGYVPETKSADGEEIDAYVLGIDKPIKNFCGKCVAVIHRLNDDDDKLIIIPNEMKDISDEEIINKTHFQEKFFKSIILRK